MTNPNTSVTTYGYEGANTLRRLLSVNNTRANASNISQFAYGYTSTTNRDSRSFMTRRTGTLGQQTVNYSYNSVDELTNEQATETTAITGVPYVRNEYSYDAMGNRSGFTARNISNTSRTQQTHGVNSLNQLATVASTPFTGTTPGATTTQSYTYDAGGNLATQSVSNNASSSTYTYDDADRLVSFVRRNTSGVNERRSEWIYDGLSRKKSLREQVWSGTAWRTESVKHYIYDGMEVVQERTDTYNATGTAIASTSQVNFTRTGNIGGILARSTGTTTLTHLFFHYDGSGNVVSLTDGSQNSVAEYSYDAYGNALTATGTQASSNAYRYSTKELHSWTGFYDYGYRFYSPALGRWINRDPIEEAGGLNLYGFGPNSPVNGFDEYGMDWLDNLSNGSAGWGDTLSYGATKKIREWMGTDDMVDPCNPWYRGGGVIGDVHQRLMTRGRGKGGNPFRNFASPGRAGKQPRLKALAKDLKVARNIRGWIKNEQRHIKNGNRTSIRLPRNSRKSPHSQNKGMELAHKRGKEARKGNDYSDAQLNDPDLHSLQHKYDNFGKKR